MMIIGCGLPSEMAASLLVGDGDGRNGRAEAGAGERRCGAVLSWTGGAGADRDGSDGEEEEYSFVSGEEKIQKGMRFV